MDNDVLINSLLNATSLEALKNQLVPCLQAIGVPYKRLCFNVTQSGTDAPVPEVNLNEVGAVFAPVYTGVGDYNLNWNLNVTDLTKIEIYGGLIDSNSRVGARVQAVRIGLSTYQPDGTAADDILQSPTSFTVLFFPGWDA